MSTNEERKEIMDESSEGSDEEEGETQTTQSRHWLTNDYLASFLIVTFVVVISLAALGSLNLQTVPTNVLLAWVLGFVTAVVWTFGGAAASAAIESIGGGE